MRYDCMYGYLWYDMIQWYDWRADNIIIILIWPSTVPTPVFLTRLVHFGSPCLLIAANQPNGHILSANRMTILLDVFSDSLSRSLPAACNLCDPWLLLLLRCVRQCLAVTVQICNWSSFIKSPKMYRFQLVSSTLPWKVWHGPKDVWQLKVEQHDTVMFERGLDQGFLSFPCLTLKGWGGWSEFSFNFTRESGVWVKSKTHGSWH